MHTKFIFVTGGVVSSLGKGITAASLGRLLKSRGLKVSMQKFDPYINVDPGTMNPYQHGEVFVTDDGAETDLDLGHYERFIDESLTQAANVTSGRVYYTVITRERKGEYLGKTVQVIPHITDEIKRRIQLLAQPFLQFRIVPAGRRLCRAVEQQRHHQADGHQQHRVKKCQKFHFRLPLQNPGCAAAKPGSACFFILSVLPRMQQPRSASLLHRCRVL